MDYKKGMKIGDSTQNLLRERGKEFMRSASGNESGFKVCNAILIHLNSCPNDREKVKKYIEFTLILFTGGK